MIQAILCCTQYLYNGLVDDWLGDIEAQPILVYMQFWYPKSPQPSTATLSIDTDRRL